MNVPIPFRWRQAVAAGLVALPTAGLAAAEPDPFPPVRGAHTVEILYGTRKVWPVARPAPAPAVPGEVKGAPVATPPAVREETREKPAPPDPQPIILAGYSGPFLHPGFSPQTSPWLVPIPAAPPVAPPAPAAPASTVVVIREPAPAAPPPAPAAEPARGITLGGETVLGIGIGIAGLGFGFAGWRRRAATSNAKQDNPAPPPPATSDGLLLMGRYNAGPVPTSAEKFDIGPSYQTEVQEKKKVEEQNQQAVLEFILDQNLALHAELAEPDAEEPAAESAEAAPDLLPEAIEIDAAPKPEPPE
jgi:hypothetical protein